MYFESTTDALCNLTVESVCSPITGGELTASETVTAYIRNDGRLAVPAGSTRVSLESGMYYVEACQLGEESNIFRLVWIMIPMDSFLLSKSLWGR